MTFLDPNCCNVSDGEEIKPPTIIAGQDKTLTAQLINIMNGVRTLFDLTSATEIEAIFLNADGSFLEKKLSLSQITVTNAPSGIFQINLLAADTALLALTNLTPPIVYPSIEVHVTIGGKLTIINMMNCINIVQRLFPSAP